MSHNVRHILHAQLESWLLRVKDGAGMVCFPNGKKEAAEHGGASVASCPK